MFILVTLKKGMSVICQRGASFKPDTGWNDEIVALEKTAWLHFPLMKTGFLFWCKLSTDWPVVFKSFYHVWKWDNVQRARSEMRRCTTHDSTDPSYDNRTIASTLKMQIWIAMNNRDVPRVTKTKFTVLVFGVVSSEGDIMPPHIFKVGLNVNTKVYLDVLKSVVIP